MSSITDSPTGGSSRRSWLKKLGGVLGGGLLLGKSPAVAAAPLDVAAPQGNQPFLSEIMMVSFNFAPKGWALCNGQLLPINQNQALFSLLGTTYGGNGQTTFALPDLRGRVIAGVGDNVTLGQKSGADSQVLLATQIPPHVHGLKASTANGTTNLAGTSGPTVHNYLADNGGGAPQYGGNLNTALANSPAAAPPINVSSIAGGSQAHENRQPFTCLNYVIALQGIYPSSN
ncbi:phage tail protein [Hymenobacter psychrophilus]|uniref:Microcystin-dependent protein n=1 Tax=Hymenobacter psychrophilus TaxID=651662 RepID=A0A1H3HZI4_9BACT|nr:tail fiber protein [Hymenobacter psychrophilus]SDY20615.1 Microcystin-dependent protein [Hymenobacter psychrophilus]